MVGVEASTTTTGGAGDPPCRFPTPAGLPRRLSFRLRSIRTAGGTAEAAVERSSSPARVQLTRGRPSQLGVPAEEKKEEEEEEVLWALLAVEGDALLPVERDLEERKRAAASAKV